MNSHKDRNLLVALMAVQLTFITHEQLQSVLREWIQDKTRNVGDILLERTLIDRERLDLLLALVEHNIARHDGQPAKSLKALSSVSDSVTKVLTTIDDPDVQDSLTAIEGERSATRVAPVIGDPPKLREKTPDIPRFSIIRRHAVGGLGEVYVAFDHELNRQVALKEIKGQHAFDNGSRQRFVLEAEITGGLEHPGIVPVYGLGTYKDGRPFYAMRFVKGASLAEAADSFHAAHPQLHTGDFRGNDFRKLLKRFTDVCYSIEYAHSRGVLHRDLKPGNIMLGKYGETLVVDWGLAKTIERKRGDSELIDEETLRPSSGTNSSHTRMGQAVGTPAYMSPEAASGRVEEIGIPSDIFCLGATLYYVLTAKAPYRLDGPEKLDAVRDGRFPLPREINSAIPKALDAICLKAMNREPAQRYSSARAVAEEVELWLADEPVAAYADPVAVRAGRFIRRHKAFFTSAAVIGLLLLFLSGVLALILSSKNEDLRIANDRAESNARQSEANAREAETQRNIAADNAATARGIALNITEIAEKQLSSLSGQEGFRESLMDRAYEMFRDMYDQDPDNADVTWDLARVARLTGNVKLKLRKFDEARSLLEESIALQLKLNRQDTASLDYLAETYRDLASFGKTAGNLELAADSFKRAGEIIDRLLKSDPKNDALRRTAASADVERVGMYLELLNNEAAIEAATTAEAVYLELANRNPPLVMDRIVATLVTARRGQALSLLGKVDEAKSIYEAGITRGREWIERDPDDNMRFFFARLLLYYASDLSELPIVPDNAETIADEALQRLKTLVDSNAKTSYRFQLACAVRTRAVIDQARSRNDEAERGFDEAIKIHEEIVGQMPTANDHAGLAKSYFLKARFYEAIGEDGSNLDAMRQLVAKAVERQTRVAELNPSSLLDRQTLITYQKKAAALTK